MRSYKWGLMRSGQRRRMTSFNLLATLLFMQPRIQFKNESFPFPLKEIRYDFVTLNKVSISGFTISREKVMLFISH